MEWTGSHAQWSALGRVGKPEGCVGAACDQPGRSPRGYGDLSPLLGAAVLLIAVGVIGLVMRARSRGQFGTLARWGLAISVIGGVLLVTSILVQSLFSEGDFPLMPVFVIPGVLALAVGFGCFAIAVLRVIPPWAGIPLIVGALVLLGVNDQDARILFAPRITIRIGSIAGRDRLGVEAPEGPPIVAPVDVWRLPRSSWFSHLSRDPY